MLLRPSSQQQQTWQSCKEGREPGPAAVLVTSCFWCIVENCGISVPDLRCHQSCSEVRWLAGCRVPYSDASTLSQESGLYMLTDDC